MIDDALIRPDAVLRFDQLGSGPAALLLHAGGERRRVWHKIMEPLAQCGFLTVAYDQRGHGESGGSLDAPLTAFGADTAAMIEHLISPVVVGASLGGLPHYPLWPIRKFGRMLPGWCLSMWCLIPIQCARDRSSRAMACIGVALS
ncbi:alpha/beta fold hydrolase [Sphingomonas alpina]|uniref:Alpha/beta fold hydrolase n=1 Tax=Sphingomonas alpina TaxID=653931 RepID=A0A7H0LMF4_9SPHN|nr:alpha/beta fold hydrolase [Sphingomonas alpina]